MQSGDVDHMNTDPALLSFQMSRDMSPDIPPNSPQYLPAESIIEYMVSLIRSNDCP